MAYDQSGASGLMTSDDAKQSYLMGIQSAHSLEKQATYRSLISMAQLTGHQHHVAIYEQTLREEEKTFQTLLGMTDALTAKFMELSLSGERAKT